MVAARFEVDVERRPRRTLAGLPDRNRFGVRSAGFFVPAFTDHGFTLREHAADARVGRGGVEALAGKHERPRHHGVVEGAEGTHFLPRRRGDFTSCAASRNSSGDSKLRYTEAKRM